MRTIALTEAVALTIALGAAAVTAAPTSATVAPATARITAARPVADELLGVSCASLRNCLAVGGNRDADTALAETWNGSVWKTIPVKLPARSSGAALAA